MKQLILKLIIWGLIVTALFSCGKKSEKNNTSERTEISDYEYETDDSDIPEFQEIPQIINIKKTPEILTKEIQNYTITIITEEKKVKLEDTEFSLNGKDWQKTGEFKNIKCGKHTFYTRNKQNKSLQDQKEIYFECFVDIPLPTTHQLNELLKQIADCDDNASDDLRKYSKNLPVNGVADISNIEQLIRNACMNGIIYSVQKIETDKNGNLTAITINKN